MNIQSLESSMEWVRASPVPWAAERSGVVLESILMSRELSQNDPKMIKPAARCQLGIVWGRTLGAGHSQQCVH